MMRTKVLIVDDEGLERLLIRKSFPWEEEGFEVVGEAADGEEALEFFDTRRPDIVLTDVNMPHMDGLQLAEEIRRRTENCEIIMITGYREFEYARRALKLGVKDFLLKPINLEEIKETVLRVREQIMKREGQDTELKNLKEDAEQNRRILEESFLQRLVSGRLDEEETVRKLQMFSLEELLGEAICMSVRCTCWKEGEEEASRQQKQILALAQEYPGVLVAFIHYLGDIVVYFRGTEEENMIYHGTKLHDEISKELGLLIQAGISARHWGAAGLPLAYEESQKALSAGVIWGRGACTTYENYRKIKDSSQGTPRIDWKEFLFCVENGAWEKIGEQIDEYTDSMKETGMFSEDYLKLMAMTMISKVSAVFQKQGRSVPRLLGENEFYDQVSSIRTVADMNAQLKDMIGRILELHRDSREKRPNSLAEQAEAFLDKYLFDERLGLKMTAEKLYVNESYLSRVFKKTMGESLIEYITRRRIEESVKLLNTTDLKAYEIAERVGIPDPHYFGICFKKQMGITVKEYKNRI